MQFLIVLAAALACAVADPQVHGFSYSSVQGAYPVGYTGVGYPHAGYTGYNAGYNPLAYTAGVAPVAYTAGVAAPVAYPFGYSGVYPGYTGFGAPVHSAEVIAKRSKRAAVFPASTGPLAYTAPIAYTGAAHYTAPVAHYAAATPFAATQYAAAPFAYSAPAASQYAYSAVYPAGYKSPVAYQAPFNYGYNSPVVAY